MIPLSVIMMTKNEAVNIKYSLPALIKHCDDVHVVDSHSADETVKIATQLGANIANFEWNGKYPKKKQWALDNLSLKHDWVLFVDADEGVTRDLVTELKELDFKCDGYFIQSDMVWMKKRLKYGMKNNKLCLFKKSMFHYPIIDDLDIDGGWEVEGHYQPVMKGDRDGAMIGQLKSRFVHYDRKGEWQSRHDQYVLWEQGMNEKRAWPVDPVFKREFVKEILRASQWRPYFYFLYGYVFKGGFLDGKEGLDYAIKRFGYNRRIGREAQLTKKKV